MNDMEKVIFDTNFLIEKRLKNFFGKRDELEKFAKTSEIIIPDIVIGELKERYKRDFILEKEKFNKVLLCNIAKHNINEIEIEKKIEELLHLEKIKYTIIELKNPKILFEMKKLALEKLPPFEDKPGTDKGFKDSYIYFTVLEYLQNAEDKFVFFITEDILLKNAFEKHQNIIVVKNYEEFIQNNINILCDNYFIDKLKDEFDSDIKPDSIKNYWLNINENYVLLIDTKKKKYVLEMESGEILGFEEIDKYYKKINSLIYSNDFDTTKISIENLLPFIHYLSNEEIINILEATVKNEQINRIIANEDVKEFIGKLYDGKKDILTLELKDNIRRLLDG